MKLHPSNRGYTVLETTIASVLTLIIGLTVILSMVQSLHQRRFERERAVALNRASEELELLKRQLFTDLKSTPRVWGSAVTEEIHLANPIAINMDVLNTPDNQSDDLPGQLFVRLSHYETDQFIPNIYFTATSPDTREIGDAVQVKVTVQWSSEGKTHSQTINSIMAP